MPFVMLWYATYHLISFPFLLSYAGFLSWDVSDCHVDLEEELNTITQHAPEGEEARHGKLDIRSEWSSQRSSQRSVLSSQLSALSSQLIGPAKKLKSNFNPIESCRTGSSLKSELNGQLIMAISGIHLLISPDGDKVRLALVLFL